MAKSPKAPKFQPLPTLEGLAARRRQTVRAVLVDWNVTGPDDLVARLKREGLAPVEDPNGFFPQEFKEPVVLLPKVELNKEKMVEAVERAKKVIKETEQESKKPTKAKLTSDADDRAADEPVRVGPEKTDGDKHKA